jgi:metal-dependent amidase/aminoacylase/carboxypeptidase family protein
LATAATKPPDYAELYSRASTPEAQMYTVGLRRQIHQNPELMYKEHETSALVQSTLCKLNVPYTTGWGVNTRPER